MTRLDYNLQSQWQSNGNQSPLDIESAGCLRRPFVEQPLQLELEPQFLPKVEQENGPQFPLKGNLYLGKQLYRLTKLHFHDGSEHYLDHQQAACELHIVCQNDAKQLLVLAILANVSANAKPVGIAKLYQEADFLFDLTACLPTSLAYYQYQGSLTTPPLLENVTWLVLSQTINLNQADYQAINEDYPANHRELQPVNKRPIYFYR